MSKLYHFGDSYATVKLITLENRHFCNIIAEDLDMEYIPFGRGGISNEMILKKVIENLHKFQSGDIIFINFSFFERGCYYDSKTKIIDTTSKFYNDIRKSLNENLNYDNKMLPNLLNYYLNNTEDYSRRIFDIFDLILKFIDKLGIKIFYIFAGNSDYENDLLSVGTNIKFKNGFCNWLIKNGFHKEQDVHYTKGIQPMLADVILRKTNNFNIEIGKSIDIDVNDIDVNMINKTNKLL